MGEADREDMSYLREDFWATTSNKQLNFLQHVWSLLTINGRASGRPARQRAVRGRGRGGHPPQTPGRVRRPHPAAVCPPVSSTPGGVKANVLFFDRKPPSEKPWTDKLWIYDFRTNQRFTLKTRALTRTDLDDFVACYNPDNRHERIETERFRAFRYDDLSHGTRHRSTSSGCATSPWKTPRTCPPPR